MYVIYCMNSVGMYSVCMYIINIYKYIHTIGTTIKIRWTYSTSDEYTSTAYIINIYKHHKIEMNSIILNILQLQCKEQHLLMCSVHKYYIFLTLFWILRSGLYCSNSSTISVWPSLEAMMRAVYLSCITTIYID